MDSITLVGKGASWDALGEIIAGPNLQVRMLDQPELALAARLVHSTDLFVVDLNVIDGEKFIRSVSAIRPYVPVLVAAKPDHPGRLAAIEAGAAGLVRLPMDHLEMVSAIYAALRMPRPEAALALDILQSLQAKVAVLDEEARPVYLNRAAADFWPAEPGADLGLLYPRDLAELAADRYRPEAADAPQLDDVQLLGAQDRPTRHRLLRGKLELQNASCGGDIVVAFADSTAERARPQKAAHSGFRAFLPIVAHRLADDAGHGRCCALFLVHVGGLVPVNQDYGFIVGDRLMHAVEGRLRAGVSSEQIQVARIAGDEFAVVLSTDAGDAIAPAAEKLLAACNCAVSFAGERLSPRLVLGGAQAPHDADNAEGLYRAAATALLQARAAGADGIMVMASREDAYEDRDPDTVEDPALSFRAALSADALELAYQPVIDLATGRWSALEALLRWRREDRGDVAPRDIIALAAAEGLLADLTAWMAARLTRDEARTRDAGLPDLRYIMHLSAEQVRQDTLRTQLSALHPLAADARLDLLVTPSAASDAAALDALVTLHQDGFALSLRLSRAEPRMPEGLPSAIRVKIDATDIDVLNRQILSARLNGCPVTGGNVEEATQLVRLRELGFAAAQGYYIQPPLNLTELIALVRSGEP
jgi:diguanylate cyclase (GGDEF)-like protein